jgi:hypothetical protein
MNLAQDVSPGYAQVMGGVPKGRLNAARHVTRESYLSPGCGGWQMKFVASSWLPAPWYLATCG